MRLPFVGKLREVTRGISFHRPPTVLTSHLFGATGQRGLGVPTLLFEFSQQVVLTPLAYRSTEGASDMS